MPTALWMYSLRQLSRTCFSSPGKLWLYSGDTMTRPSASVIAFANAGSLIASPASSTGIGTVAMSMSAARDAGASIQQVGEESCGMRRRRVPCAPCRESQGCSVDAAQSRSLSRP